MNKGLFKVAILVSMFLGQQALASSTCEDVELKKEEYLKTEYVKNPSIQVIQNCGCSNGCKKEEKEKVKVIYKDRIVYKEAKPKVIYKDRVVYRESEPKIIYKDRVVYKDKVIYRDKIVPEEKVVYKPVYKTKTKIKKVFVKERHHEHRHVYKKQERNHSVSLLGVFSKTNIETNERDYNYQVGGIHEGEHDVQVKRSYEADLGIMYQYDIDRLRLSIGGTLGGTGLLGIGVKF